MEALRTWAGEGRRLTLATIVGASGSAPRPIGAKLLVADDGRMAGLKGSTIRITPPSDLVDLTSKHVPSFDRRSGSRPDLRCSVTGRVRPSQSPMWSLLHVVSNVSLEHSLEVPTTVDQDLVEALLAHGPHERRVESKNRT